MSNLYSEMILEYYKHPKNKGSISNPDINHHEHNPLCGDRVTIQAMLDEEKKNKISVIKFDGEGCAISIASSSILTQLVKGMSLKEIIEFDRDDLLAELGITLSPNRIKCALLGLETLKEGIRQYLGDNVIQKFD